MERFRCGQRVKMIDTDSPLLDRVGTVHRLLIRDESAWVAMNEPIPAVMIRSPHGDARCDYVNLWPDQCEHV